VTVHGGVQVEIFDADRYVFCIGSGWDPVEALGCNDSGSGSTNVSRILDEVAATDEADTFGFSLLWSQFGNDALVGSALSCWQHGLVAVVGGLDTVDGIVAGAEF
jgi:hypothetical protein